MDSSDNASLLLSSILTPAKGFHTTSTTRLALRGSGSRSCTLHLYFSLPTQLFADPYELAHRRASYAFERLGGGNLEAPAFAPGAGGPSGLLLDVVVPDAVDLDEGIVEIDVDVPLHARYGVPKTGADLMDEVVLPPPEAFWACPASGDGEGAPRPRSNLLLFFSPFLLPLVGELSLNLRTAVFSTTTTIALTTAPPPTYSKTHASATRCAPQRRRARTRAHRYRRKGEEGARVDSARGVGSRADAPRTRRRCGRRGRGGDWHGGGDLVRFRVSPTDYCASVPTRPWSGRGRKRDKKGELKFRARLSISILML